MKRLVFSVVAVWFAVASLARAHFVWFVPGAGGVHIVFSDTLEPDSADFLAKIMHTECFACSGEGKAAAVKFVKDKDVLKVADAVKGAGVVGGVCRYGVLQKGGKEPFLLNYYGKTLVGPASPAHAAAHDKLVLDIHPTKEAGAFEVRFQGRPLADAELVILTPGKAETTEAKSDKTGRFTVALPSKGVYGIRAKHIERKAGEVDGKKYESIRHYATLTFENR